jgi:hypothetical protein
LLLFFGPFIFCLFFVLPNPIFFLMQEEAALSPPLLPPPPTVLEVCIVENEDFVGGLYAPSERHYTDLAGARSPGPESELLLGHGWFWSGVAWSKGDWEATLDGRRRKWLREKSRNVPDQWVIMDSREETAATATPWTRLYATFRTLSSTLLPLQGTVDNKKVNVERFRAVMALTRVLARYDVLAPAVELLESDDKNSSIKSVTMLRSLVVEKWLDVAGGNVEEARVLLQALQRVVHSLDRDSEEYVAVVNSMQPLVYVTGGQALEQAENSENEECRKFFVTDVTGHVVEIVLFEDTLMRGSDLMPLDWVWIAHQKEKKIAKIITLDGKVFAFTVTDLDVLDLLRGTG